MIGVLLFLILFALLFPKALKFILALMLIGGIMILGEVHAKPRLHSTDCSGPIMKLPPGCEIEFQDNERRPDINSLICQDIIGTGWNHMPEIADYIKTKPNAEKLGYGSECHLDALVFSQCWLEPHWPVTKAINALLRKAANGEKLPDTPACGA